MRITSSLALLILCCSLSCKEGSEQKTPPPSVAESSQTGADPPGDLAAPNAGDEPPAPSFRTATSSGVPLVAKGKIIEPPVSWNAGITTIYFQAREKAKGTIRNIEIEMFEDDSPIAVASCEQTFDAINAYLDSESVLYIVCETEHSEATPGTSIGVRLEWKDGQVKQAGSFENEGPPAYDTMDFGEGE